MNIRRGKTIYIKMTDPFSVLSIVSIITSHTLIFRKYRKKERNSTIELPIKKEYNDIKIRNLNALLCIEKLRIHVSCESNSLKFRPVKQKNYKFPK